MRPKKRVLVFDEMYLDAEARTFPLETRGYAVSRAHTVAEFARQIGTAPAAAMVYHYDESTPTAELAALAYAQVPAVKVLVLRRAPLPSDLVVDYVLNERTVPMLTILETLRTAVAVRRGPHPARLQADAVMMGRV